MMSYKLNKITLVTISSALLLIGGCSSGGVKDNTTAPNSNVNGPISLTEIRNIFHPKQNLSLKADGSGCGQVMGNVGSISSFADGFINFIPVVGHAINFVDSEANVVLGYTSAQAGSSCTQNEFGSMQSQLNYQETQIQQLSEAIQTQNTEIWDQLALAGNQSFQTAYTAYKNALAAISGANGSVNAMMNAAGLWNSNTGGLGQNAKESASIAVNNILTNKYANYVNLANAVSDLNPNNITNIAGVAILSNGKVVQNLDSSFLTTLASLNVALKEALASTMANNPNQNVVPFIHKYNVFINQLYVTNVLALQQAYFANYFVNYMNYVNYRTSLVNSNNQPTQMNYLANKNLEVPGVYFAPAGQPDSNCSIQDTSEAAVTACYNQAQQALSELYANILNQLYLNALNYIISDTPAADVQTYSTLQHMTYSIQNGKWESTGETIDYAGQVSLNVESSLALVYSLYKANNLGTLVTSLVNLQNQSSYLERFGIYQEPLTNPIACANALKQYNQAGGGSYKNFISSSAFNNYGCGAPIIRTGNGYLPDNAFDKVKVALNTFTPFLYSTQTATSNVENNIGACNPNPAGGLPGFNMYFYNNGMFFLMCGNWKTTDFPINGQVTYSPANANYILGQIVNKQWGNAGVFQLGNGIYNLTLMNANSDFFTMQGSALSATGLSHTAPSSGTYGGFSNIAAIQITLPGGLIVPLGVAYTNRSGQGGNQMGLVINPVLNSVTVAGWPILDKTQMSMSIPTNLANQDWGTTNSIYGIVNDGYNLKVTGGFAFFGFNLYLQTDIDRSPNTGTIVVGVATNPFPANEGYISAPANWDSITHASPVLLNWI